MFSYLVLLLLISQCLAENPLVKLPNGWIRGLSATTFSNKTYYRFEKIPYAAPPVGNLRFKAPQPMQNWEGILNTTNLDVSCYQQWNNGDYENEDCLYLNVFTPHLPANLENGLLPVMFYIHGGGFIGGTGMGIHSEFLLNEDVVVVVINYRLGPLGFLSTQDEVIPGNNGLKDQHFALQWTHDNIKLFGGDPQQVTIFGLSAGSASVAYHLLNQKSKGLFQAAIAESGSFLSPWAYQRRAREIAFTTASLLNETFKTNNDSTDLLNFLLTVPAKDIDTAAEVYHNFESSPEDYEISQGFYWAPIVEVPNPDAFLVEKMYGLLKSGNVVSVPLLIGICSEENLSFNLDPDVTKSDMEAFDQHLDWIVPNDMQVFDKENRLEIGRAIREIYTKGEPLANNVGAGVRMGSDNSFTRSIIKHAELYSNLSTTYFYQFSYDGQLPNFNVHYDGAEAVGHGEEYVYFFCVTPSCDINEYSDSDQLTAKRLVKLWTNFAKFKNPTPEENELFQNVIWPYVNITSGDFLYLDINEDLSVKNHPKADTYQKWINIYDNLGYDDFDTY